MERLGHVPLVQHWNRSDLIPPLRVDSSGRHGPTRYELVRDDWRRTSQGLHVPRWVDGDRVEQRIVEAAANLGSYGGVTGWAALRWVGASWFDGTAADRSLLPVCLAADNMRKPANAVLSEERLNRADLLVVDGLSITRPVRSVAFEMRYADSIRAAVVWLDMAAYDDLVSVAEVWSYVDNYLNGWTGVPQLRLALALVAENSWSPQETRLRLVWVLDAGLPTPLCNRPVFDLDGRHIGTPDLLDIEAGLLVQYDGPDHLDPARAALDAAQDLRYTDAGLAVVRVVHDDMTRRDRLAARLVEERAAALTTRVDRGWTIQCPESWAPTWTVEQRRALDADAAARWLRYRSRSSRPQSA